MAARFAGLIVIAACAASPRAVLAEPLINADFEADPPTYKPTGWTVLTGLDAATYTPPAYGKGFAEITPRVAAPGRGGRGHAIVIHAEGSWRCEVSEHSKGRIGGEPIAVPGQHRGKAAAYQVVSLAPGTYRFGVYLRTADGDPWAAAFSLGIAVDGTTRYAHDDSTGIVWTKHALAMRGDPNGDYTAWGEWQHHTTAPFTLDEPGSVSVWIRLNYVNENQMSARWEVDDAAIERVPDAPFTSDLVLSGEWDDTPPPVESIADFELMLDAAVRPTWRRLELRFREPLSGDDGFVLSLARSGEVTLRSIADGVLRRASMPRSDDAINVRIVARAQYLRIDLPGEAGFETRAIGSREGRLTITADPAGSARLRLSLRTAPPELPELPVPSAGEFAKIYDPSFGEDGPWYINDHCVIREQTGLWHLFGITHAEPFSPPDEDFFAHAASRELMRTPWAKLAPVCPVNEADGETHVWAPHVVEKDGVYYMFYCGGGTDGDAYQINLRTSTDLTDWRWYDGNPLFTDIGHARDPMVLRLSDGRYLMYYTRPASIEEPFSAVAVRESDDLLHWSEPSLALVTHRRQPFGRLTESPFVFRCAEGNMYAYYLSATGMTGYRDSTVWRSVNPRFFDSDHVVARIDAHAPEWITTPASDRPGFVTHCGWGQGGFHIAPVTWARRAWAPFGLLVAKGRAEAASRSPVAIEVRRPGADGTPYRTFTLTEGIGSYALPPGRYRVYVRGENQDPAGGWPVEVAWDERTYLDLPATP